MKTITHILKNMVFVLIIFSFSPGMGQNTGYYSFLPNLAGDIDKDGFDIGYHSVFNQWDNNGDGNIADTEFYQIIFQRLDTNGDQTLSEEEFAPAQKYLLDPYSNGQTFRNYDSNGDNKLSPSEFELALNISGLFNRHDTNRDGMLTRFELHAMVYRLMDLDGNGVVDKREFDRVRDLYID